MNRDRTSEAGELEVRGSARPERGTALLEFALVFPMLLVLTLGVVDISRAFWVKNVAHQASREGARLLAVRSLADSASVRARVLQVTGAAHVGLKSLTLAGPDADRMMAVEVGVEFDWIFPGLFAWLGGSFDDPMTLRAESVMRREG